MVADYLLRVVYMVQCLKRFYLRIVSKMFFFDLFVPFSRKLRYVVDSFPVDAEEYARQ